jgi:hypothetical protein
MSSPLGFRLGALALVSAFMVACSSGKDDRSDASEPALTACLDSSPVACTPDPGSDTRQRVSDLLRAAVLPALTKSGVTPAASDVKFLYKTMRILDGRVYAAATIKRGDGATDFDLAGTLFAGETPTVQALINEGAGTVFTHRLGVGLDPTVLACAFVTDAMPAGLYPNGDPAKDCPSAVSGAMPTTIGACVDTTILKIEGRIDGDTDFSTGTAVEYANNGHQVSFDKVNEIIQSRVGDQVHVCLKSIPTDCPPDDDRGKVYTATNKRTGQSWTESADEHSCGGA